MRRDSQADNRGHGTTSKVPFHWIVSPDAHVYGAVDVTNANVGGVATYANTSRSNATPSVAPVNGVSSAVNPADES